MGSKYNKESSDIEQLIDECAECAVDYETGEIDETVVNLQKTLRTTNLLIKILELI